MPLSGVAHPGRQEVEEIARLYTLGDVKKSTLCHHGVSNSNYKLTTSEGEFLLRIYPGGTQGESIEFEISVINILNTQGFPAQKPLKDVKEHYINYICDNPYVILTFIPGESLSKEGLTADVAVQVGELFGRMQNLLDGFKPSGAARTPSILS